MSDFIEDLKGDILKAMPDVSPVWAEFNAIITLSTLLNKARIIEQEKPLGLNLIMLIIAPPGIKKSLPMTSFTYPILKETGELIGKDLILPSRSSVPGFIKVLNEREEDVINRKGEVIQRGEPIHNQGIVIRDEFSGLFKGMRTEGWQSDGMEFISEMYDRIFQKRATTKHGLHAVEDLYGNLLSCSTYHFLSMMDPEFFTQGTGNRFLYCHYGADEYEVKPIDSEEYFRESWGSKRDNTINKYSGLLRNIYNKCIKKIYITGGGELYGNYRERCEIEWKEECEKDPMGWKHHPIKRYPELALKLAGIYAVSNKIERIIKMPDEKWDYSVCVEERHMKKAIMTVERNREHFKEIVAIKGKNIDKEKPKSIEDEAKYALGFLASAPEQILSSVKWLALIPYGNRNKKIEIKRYCLIKGWIEVVGYKEVDEETREKLEMCGNQAQLVKYVKGL